MTKPIEQQVAELTNKLNRIKSMEVPRAVSSALNKTAGVSKTRTVRGVAKSIGLPQKHVRKRVYIARSKPGTLRVRLRSYYRAVNAIFLPGIRDTGKYKKGHRGRVGSGVKARGGWHWEEAFIAKGKGGKKSVFYRTQRNAGAKDTLKAIRIDIEKEVNAIAPKAAERELRQNFPMRLKRDLAYRLQKYEV